MKTKIELLLHTKHTIIESETAGKRIDWCKENYRNSKSDTPVTPREAFDLLFFDYMKLPKEKLPVVRETESEIIWLSKNECDTLEACKEIGLDTRKVCRDIYEKSTQAFISQLDPQLRFCRDYNEIRPYAEHCKEMIFIIDFEEMMKIALEEAKLSRKEGNKGYGAVVVSGGKISGKAHDTAVTENDPSLHAEVNAIRQAVKNTGDVNLCGSILFSTCEPCPMCASLAVWANITTIVYGVSIEETAKLGKSRILIGCREVVEKSPVMIEVIGGILKNECKKLYI